MYRTLWRGRPILMQCKTRDTLPFGNHVSRLCSPSSSRCCIETKPIYAVSVSQKVLNRTLETQVYLGVRIPDLWFGLVGDHNAGNPQACYALIESTLNAASTGT